jgi:hypothetical protein
VLDEVERMLDARGRTGQFLSTPAVTLAQDAESSLEGQRIGPLRQAASPVSTCSAA